MSLFYNLPSFSNIFVYTVKKFNFVGKKLIQELSNCISDQEGIFSPARANWIMLYWGFLPSSGSTVGKEMCI